MSSLVITSKAGHTPAFSRNICFLLLQVLNSVEFRISRLEVDTIDLSEFFRFVHVNRFDSAFNLVRLGDGKADRLSEESYCTSIFGDVK